MISVKEVRDFLELGLFPALVGCLAGGATIALDFFQVPYFSGLPAWALVAAGCLIVVCGSILAAHVIKSPVTLWRFLKARRLGRREKEIRLQNLSEVNEEERYVLAYYFSANERVFHAKLFNPVINSLRAKRLIVRHDGRYSMLEWPFSFNDDVWDEMTRNAEQWTVSDVHFRKPPFRRW